MEYDDLIYACAFSSAFDNSLFAAKEILQHLESFKQIFSLTREEWKEILRGNDGLVNSIMNPKLLDIARRDVDLAATNGIKILPITDENYPHRFRECPDASPVLFYKGTADLNAARTLAVVGTRRSTYYGNTTCKSLISDMSDISPKPVIISGLAYGIDECAHRTALECGLETIAVVPGCITNIYPAGHRALADKIVCQGGILSDRPISNSEITPGSFQRRNRIIAGTSDATLLVESYAKGGGLITTSFAASYGREIYAVPGRFGEKSFEGCNNLISRNIAALVYDSDTIPVGMGWKSKRKKKKVSNSYSGITNPLQRKVIELLAEKDMLGVDEIAAASGMKIADVCTCLTDLELAGVVTRAFSDRYLLSKP